MKAKQKICKPQKEKKKNRLIVEVLINNGNKISGITNWSKLDPVWCFLENTVTVTVKNLTRKSRKILEADGTKKETQKQKYRRNRNTEEHQLNDEISIL